MSGPAGKDRSPPACDIGDLFRLLGRVHMLDILHEFLREPGPLRFLDLEARLGISPNTLSDRLKALVDAGLLSRTPLPGIPPRVDYAVTARAEALQPVFIALARWCDQHYLGCDELAAPLDPPLQGAGTPAEPAARSPVTRPRSAA